MSIQEVLAGHKRYFQMDDSYFFCSNPGLGDGPRSQFVRTDSLEDLFTLSGCNTPTETAPAVREGVSLDSTSNQCGGGGIGMMRQDPNSGCYGALRSHDNSCIEQSIPITIEYTKVKSAALIEPLSARIDPAEAFFHRHEEERRRKRSTQPHPFGHGVEKARQLSITETEAGVSSAQPCRTAPYSSDPVSRASLGVRPVPAVRKTDADVPATIARPTTRALGETLRTRTVPVVEAYNPTGIRGSAASLGKYYPTNYNGGSNPTGSPFPVPEAAAGPSLSPSATDQERQLRQYKLDIISQTTQIARETLGRRLQSTASSKAMETALDERTRKSIALLRRYKPSSPRITPLLSPGPVTPMALDGNGGSDYLSVREAKPR